VIGRNGVRLGEKRKRKRKEEMRIVDGISYISHWLAWSTLELNLLDLLLYWNAPGLLIFDISGLSDDIIITQY